MGLERSAKRELGEIYSKIQGMLGTGQMPEELYTPLYDRAMKLIRDAPQDSEWRARIMSLKPFSGLQDALLLETVKKDYETLKEAGSIRWNPKFWEDYYKLCKVYDAKLLDAQIPLPIRTTTKKFYQDAEDSGFDKTDVRLGCSVKRDKRGQLLVRTSNGDLVVLRGSQNETFLYAGEFMEYFTDKNPLTRSGIQNPHELFLADVYRPLIDSVDLLVRVNTQYMMEYNIIFGKWPLLPANLWSNNFRRLDTQGKIPEDFCFSTISRPSNFFEIVARLMLKPERTLDFTQEENCSAVSDSYEESLSLERHVISAIADKLRSSL